MRKLSLTLVCAVVSFLSYGQVIESDTAKKGSVMDPIRAPIDGTVEKVHIEHYKPVRLPYIRQADLHWSALVWRVIDLRERFNFPLYYPTEKKGNWKSLMQAILDAIDSTEANPTPLRVYTDEYVNIPVSISEMLQSMGENITVEIYDPESFEKVGEEIKFVAFGAKEVFRYEVKEQWRIDKQRSVMDQKIISIKPMFWFEKVEGGGGDGDDYGGGDEDFMEEGEDGEAMPVLPTRRWRNFGWIYYDELRPTLAVTEVFNPANNAQRRNYDDLFLTRRFSSFIKAQENVQDNREINMYILNGMDQALESERIKERIRVKEHDMWEY